MSGDPLQILHQATLRLLERTGVFVDSSDALSVLAGRRRAGRPGQPASLSAGEGRRAGIAHGAQVLRVYGRGTGAAAGVRRDTDLFPVRGASLRVLELDGRLATANITHLHQFNRLLDALPFVHMLINQVDPWSCTAPTCTASWPPRC